MPENTETSTENEKSWWLAYPGLIATGTISTLVASGLIYAGSYIVEPRWIAKALVSDDMEFALEIIADNQDQLQNRDDDLRNLGLIRKENVFKEAARLAKSTDDGWDNLRQSLVSAGLLPSKMEQLLETVLDWHRMRLPKVSEEQLALLHSPSPRKPASDEVLEEFSDGVGGYTPMPFKITLEDTDGPSGSIVVPQLDELGYRYNSYHHFPTKFGKATRMLFVNGSNNRDLDIIIAQYKEPFDPNELPRGYYSDHYDHFIRQSGDYIFMGIGKEVPGFLEQIVWKAISANTY